MSSLVCGAGSEPSGLLKKLQLQGAASTGPERTGSYVRTGRGAATPQMDFFSSPLEKIVDHAKDDAYPIAVYRG
jgi:hypothetical protein